MAQSTCPVFADGLSACSGAAPPGVPTSPWEAQSLLRGGEEHMVSHTVPVRLLMSWLCQLLGVRLKAKCQRHPCVTATPSCQVLLCLGEQMWKTNQNPSSLLSSALGKRSHLKFLCSLKMKYQRSLVLKFHNGVFMIEKWGLVSLEVCEIRDPLTLGKPSLNTSH